MSVSTDSAACAQANAAAGTPQSSTYNTAAAMGSSNNTALTGQQAAVMLVPV
jgi:hypothetical protein